MLCIGGFMQVASTRIAHWMTFLQKTGVLSHFMSPKHRFSYFLYAAIFLTHLVERYKLNPIIKGLENSKPFIAIRSKLFHKSEFLLYRIMWIMTKENSVWAVGIAV